MNVSDEIIKVLDALGEKIGVAIDWTGNNVIPYVEQLCQKYIKWEIATSIAWMVVWLLIAIAFFIILRLYKKCGWYKKTDWDDWYSAAIIFTWIFFILSAITLSVNIFVQTFDIIECCVFPEKVIFEEVKSILAPMNTQ